MLIDDLVNAHKGETCWIVGKGPSLRHLRAEHFGPGPVIALNDAIVAVEALGLGNPLYSLQKDGHPDFMVRPGDQVVLILQNTEGFSRDWFPEHPQRVVVEPITELGFDHVQVLSVRMAISIAKIMGCASVMMVCTDNLVNDSLETFNPRTGEAKKTGAAQWYELTKPYIMKDLESISHEFILPRRGSMLKKLFTSIYTNNAWASQETRSGGGSELGRTTAMRLQLASFLQRLDVKTILDAGCGDWNWMSQVYLGKKIKIKGCDIVEELVQSNREKYGDRFFVADLTCDPLPKVDLVLCRQVLGHLSYANIHQALQNIKASGAKYMLLTHFPTCAANQDIKDGGWRQINFCLPPFNLPEPTDRIPDENGSIALWRLS